MSNENRTGSGSAACSSGASDGGKSSDKSSASPATVTNARLLDGRWLAKQSLASIARQLKQLPSLGASISPSSASPSSFTRPGLAVILVGDNPASKVYVANKAKAAREIGFETFDTVLDGNATFSDVAAAIERYNQNPQVHGILLQLPLPAALAASQSKLLDLILPHKDADGLHPINQGKLMRGDAVLKPCTPLGVMRLIDLAYAQIDTAANSPESIADIPCVSLAGKKAIVIGRSILVGKPVAQLLLERNATVVMAHSRTANLPTLCHEADIVVAAVGVPELVRGEWIKPGAIVIDVGINRRADGSLCGDVAFAEARSRAAAITPVPGGAGPMTIAMLLQNTFNGFLGKS